MGKIRYCTREDFRKSLSPHLLVGMTTVKPGALVTSPRLVGLGERDCFLTTLRRRPPVSCGRSTACEETRFP